MIWIDLAMRWLRNPYTINLLVGGSRNISENFGSWIPMTCSIEKPCREIQSSLVDHMGRCSRSTFTFHTGTRDKINDPLKFEIIPNVPLKFQHFGSWMEHFGIPSPFIPILVVESPLDTPKWSNEPFYTCFLEGVTGRVESLWLSAMTN